MICADTDFFLALFKESDWLKERALRRLSQYAGQLWTSAAGPLEVLLLAGRHGFRPERAMRDMIQLAEIRGIDARLLLHAANLMEDLGFTAFDALHAAQCIAAGDPILSSDHVYERIGVKRVPLEG